MTLDTYKTIPVGSILLLEAEAQLVIIEEFLTLPSSVKKMVVAPQTGAFIRGLVKIHKLPPDQAPFIAFNILKITLGRTPLNQLSAILSTKLQIPSETARAVSTEIEKELFAPVALDLNQYLGRKKEAPSSPPMAAASPVPNSTGEASNVLNLKEQKTPPKPPQVPI